MTSTVNIDDKNVAKINITIKSDIAKNEYSKALRAYAMNVNIAGFRKGKAPFNVVEKYIGTKRIKNEVIDRLFPVEFQKVIKENKLDIAFRPNITHVDFEIGNDMKIEAAVELKPEVKLGKIKDVEVEYKEFKNPENAIENELFQTQKRFSSLEKVDRLSTKEDTVIFDFEGFVGEEKIEHGDAKNYTLDLSNSNFIPGFAEGLTGHKAGEEFTIDVKFPKDYHEDKLKNADARFKIKLHEVKTRKMPELNDELAKKAGKDTLEDLKKDIEKYLSSLEENRNNTAKSEAIFNKIFETTEIKVQDTMLDREYSAIVEEAKMHAKKQNADYNELVKKEGKDNIEKRFREEAEKRIKNSLIVEKIASVAELKIEQKDVMEHVNQMAAMYGLSAVKLFEELRKNPNLFASVSQQITANKVNQYLLDNNKFIAKV